jgi:activator of HSP90 ATPase
VKTTDPIPGTSRISTATPIFVQTRRNALVTMALATAGIVTGLRAKADPVPVVKAPDGAAANPARTALHYDVTFNATPHRIYEILSDSKEFAALTGLPATIDAREGGAFSIFGGVIVGRNIELVPDQRIVQAWRPAYWEAGVYSLVKFDLRMEGSKSRLVLDHNGFPEGLADHLNLGWYGHYLKPLAKLLP